MKRSDMLIAFSGLKGAGKDTAAQVLVDEFGFTKISFAEALRQLLMIINPEISFEDMWGVNCRRLSQIVKESGWDEAKRNYPEVRRLMQVTGTEGVRMLFGENAWIDILARRYPDLSNDETRYVITDCRFDNEVDFVRNQGGMLVWVDRKGLVSDGHASESDHIKELASVVLHNDETIDEFHEDVRFVLHIRGIDKIEQSGRAS
jgi:hypothetical protein